MNNDINARIAEIIGRICRTEYRSTTVVDIYEELGVFALLAADRYILELIKLRLIEQPHIAHCTLHIAHWGQTPLREC